jgi:hypothetical protein
MPFCGTIKCGTSYTINRKLIMLEEGVWLSVQDVICDGEHEIVEYFHLDNEVIVSEKEGIVTLKNDNAVLNVYSDDQLNITEGIISKKYNELVKAPLLTKSCDMVNRKTNCTLFVGEGIKANKTRVYQVGKNVEVPDEFITAWDIEVDGQLKWTLLVWNRETYRGGKMYICHGIPVYGKAAVLYWENESKCKRIRLKT